MSQQSSSTLLSDAVSLCSLLVCLRSADQQLLPLLETWLNLRGLLWSRLRNILPAQCFFFFNPFKHTYFIWLLKLYLTHLNPNMKILSQPFALMKDKKIYIFRLLVQYFNILSLATLHTPSIWGAPLHASKLKQSEAFEIYPNSISKIIIISKGRSW